jgi:hypothetical protein
LARRPAPRQFDALLLAVGQRADDGVADVFDFEEVDECLDALPALDFLGGVRPKKMTASRTLERRWVCRPVRMFSTTVPCLNRRQVLKRRPIRWRQTAMARPSRGRCLRTS